MEDKLNIQKITPRLLTEPITFWISLLNDYFLKKPSATVLGYPWKNQVILQTQLENERLAIRQATLGVDGLKEKAAILQKAIEENNVRTSWYQFRGRFVSRLIFLVRLLVGNAFIRVD